MKYLFLLLFLFITLIGCARLSPRAQKVVIRSNIPWLHCEKKLIIDTESFSTSLALKEIKEAAAKADANYVKIVDFNDESLKDYYQAEAYQCFQNVDKNIEVLLNPCLKKGNPKACLDLAHHYWKNGNKEDFQFYSCKACKFKYVIGCNYCQMHKEWKSAVTKRAELKQACNDYHAP
ncbi:MAG: hypothetical protein ACOCUH_04645, partial [Bacteriovoracia bacterium]